MTGIPDPGRPRRGSAEINYDRGPRTVLRAPTGSRVLGTADRAGRRPWVRLACAACGTYGILTADWIAGLRRLRVFGVQRFRSRYEQPLLFIFFSDSRGPFRYGSPLIIIRVLRFTASRREFPATRSRDCITKTSTRLCGFVNKSL